MYTKIYLTDNQVVYRFEAVSVRFVSFGSQSPPPIQMSPTPLLNNSLLDDDDVMMIDVLRPLLCTW